MNDIKLSAWGIMFKKCEESDAVVSVENNGSIRYYKSAVEPYESSIAHEVIKGLRLNKGRTKVTAIDSKIVRTLRNIPVQVVELENAWSVDIDNSMFLHTNITVGKSVYKLSGLCPKKVDLYTYVMATAVESAYEGNSDRIVMLFVAKDNKSSIDSVKFSVRVSNSAITVWVGDGAGLIAYNCKD